MYHILGAMTLAAILLCASALSPANAFTADDVAIEGQILEKVTPAWLAKAKAKYAREFVFLRKLNDANGFPEGTLPTLWVVESMCGELNIKNKHDYEGQAQLGPYEQRKYGVKNPYDLQDAFTGVVNLLRDYHVQSQLWLSRPVQWTERSRTDWYMLHQAGFRGASQQYNAAANDHKLPPDIVRNIRSNLPQTVKAQMFDGTKLKASVPHKDLVLVFYRTWDHEMNRIWTAIK